MTARIPIPRGTRDIFPPESDLWSAVEDHARITFSTYNFKEIRVPIFERALLFERSVGEDTDVVSKELYSWIDSPKAQRALTGIRELARTSRIPVSVPGSPAHDELLKRIEQGAFDSLPEQTRLVLRPEATASVCRAYIEHGMQSLPGNVKLYYIGPMFRRERPQKGRHRQFYQIGAEVLGQSDAPAIDAEVIEMLLVFFRRVGLTGATLFVNSIGDNNCRPQYIEILRSALLKVKDQLGPDSQRRIETNPLRVLDSKVPEEQLVIGTLPRITDHLCGPCLTHFAKLQEELKLRSIDYEISWRLVRGLDYYTRTTFEIVAPGLGSQNAVCGGGRYDGLIESLGGPATKGIGFAIGTDRLILSLQETSKAVVTKNLDVFVAWMGENAHVLSVKLARNLRDEDFKVELPPEEMKLKNSLGLAERLGARFALIVGKEEAASGQLTLKRLSDREQQKYSEAALLEHLRTTRQT